MRLLHFDGGHGGGGHGLCTHSRRCHYGKLSRSVQYVVSMSTESRKNSKPSAL